MAQSPNRNRQKLKERLLRCWKLDIDWSSIPEPLHKVRIHLINAYIFGLSNSVVHIKNPITGAFMNQLCHPPPPIVFYVQVTPACLVEKNMTRYICI